MTYLNVLAAIFAASTLFYVYRLFRPSHVRAIYGYHDWENEVGHGLCMAAMVTMLAPSWLPISGAVWTYILGAGALWFTARALTWGKRVLYATKWWWDWAHVVMLGGMAVMFAGFAPLWLNAVLAVFWAWLGVHYWWELLGDIRSRKSLYIGSDIAHSLMGFVMFAMIINPAAMMPGMDHSHMNHGMHHNMPMDDMPGMDHDMPMDHNMPGMDHSKMPGMSGGGGGGAVQPHDMDHCDMPGMDMGDCHHAK